MGDIYRKPLATIYDVVQDMYIVLNDNSLYDILEDCSKGEVEGSVPLRIEKILSTDLVKVAECLVETLG